MRWTLWLWSRCLLAVDRLLGTQFVEWELLRRQRNIERLVADMDVVNQELEALTEELALHRLVLCLVDLRARRERDDVENWLRFAPQSDGEELLLDDAIECLVKRGLASIDAEPAGPGRYVYNLYPDWSGIAARLSNSSVSSELMAWLDEQN